MKTSASKAVAIYVAVLCLFCAAAGAGLCWLNPARAWAGFLAMFFLPVCWGLLTVAGRRRGTAGVSAERLRSLALAGTMQAASLLAVLLSHLGLAPELAAGMNARSGGFLLGLLVVVLSNTAPKQLASARRQQVLLRSGRALVLGGMGYSAAWLFLPLAYADDVALATLMAGVVYVLAQMVLARGSCAPLKPTA